MTSHFLAIRVRPASRRIPRAPDGSLPESWLLAEWPPEADEPAGYWLSTSPRTPWPELGAAAKTVWRTASSGGSSASGGHSASSQDSGRLPSGARGMRRLAGRTRIARKWLVMAAAGVAAGALVPCRQVTGWTLVRVSDGEPSAG